MLKLLIFDWGNTLMRDFTQFEGAMAHWPKVEVIRGAIPFLENNYKKYKLCVATNAGISDTALMCKALERGEIKKYFTFFFSSKDLGFSKPDIRFFTQILLEIGIPCTEAVMIGNDYLKDIVGAKQAGLQTILFNEENREGHFPEADFVINSFDQLQEIIDIIAKS